MAGQGWATWRAATHRALYGDGGFYRRTDGAPRAHFRTSVHASPLFAGALLRLARDAGLTTVVDVGAGRGELLRSLNALDPALRLVGVEVAGRPEELPAHVEWVAEVPAGVHALLVANEWLDDVPVDVVEMTQDGPRVVEVDRAGRERLGAEPGARDLEWLARWWPLGAPGDRAEVGHPRDDAWSGAVAALGRGLAVAVDYAHASGERPAAGTLTGYRSGRQVRPVPDGSCDITSHVALDACAAAGEAAGATGTRLTTQREALRALGVRPEPPPHALSRSDPAAYVAALSAVGEAAELTDPNGLGGFSWLTQPVNPPKSPR